MLSERNQSEKIHILLTIYMKHPEQSNSYKCKGELCLLGPGASDKWL